MSNSDTYQRIGVIEATVWQRPDVPGAGMVTVRRRFRNRGGLWRSSPPTMIDHRDSLESLGKLALDLVNDARANDPASEPDVDPATTIH